MWIRRVILIICVFGTALPTDAQIGGRHVFNFLSIPNSARITALGGHHIGALDGDTDLAFSNPALLNPEMDGRISFSHQFYVGDIGSGYLSYAKHNEEKNITWHTSFRYVSYGTFDRRDPAGNLMGSFNANDLAITAGVGKQLYDRLRVGANFRLVYGNLEEYNALGAAIDLGALYRIESQQLNFSFVVKNLGTQITAFDEERESMPLDVQLGLTKRLKYLPFQFSIVAQQLHRWDIRYDDPNADEPDDILTGEPAPDGAADPFIDNFFRHLVFNGELFIGKDETVKLRLGYNHLLKQELAIENFRTLAGFSFGFGIKISQFRLDYGFGRYHIGGAANHFTLSTNLKSFSGNNIVDTN